MKQSLDLSLTQRLAMTPQLQQAIKLLQLSSTELQTEIQEALESNPLLEEPDYPGTTVLDGGEDESLSWQQSSSGPWPVRNRNNGDDAGMEIDTRNSVSRNLYDHLLEQVSETHFSEKDRVIAETLIGNINKDGYLRSSLEEVTETVRDSGIDIDGEETAAVLHQIQNFDPPGVAARDLQECLLLQLRQHARRDSAVDTACRLIEQHLDKLAKRDYGFLKKVLGVTDGELQAAIDLTQSLNPRPGSAQEPDRTQYITPDVIVRRHKGQWVAVLCRDGVPQVRINQTYRSMIKRGDNSGDNTYLKDHLQEARWLLKSIQNRHDTVLKVATAIVDRQQGFLDHGEKSMRPMVLQDIARELDVHESTISRATVNKYMYTPRGIYEFRYFFSSGLGTLDGGETSATAIQSLIKDFIDNESSKKPLSDSKIVIMLEQGGFKVARRTVAKYRDVMQIPPSNQRKTLF